MRLIRGKGGETVKYKPSLSPKIKGYVEWQLEHYHEDKRQLRESRQAIMPSCTANYSGMSGGSGPSDPTGQAAERQVLGYLTTSTMARADTAPGLMIEGA